MTDVEHWPLRHLVLRTPRLELRPDDDEGLHELVEVAYAGVHPPEEMPFLVPWTDADPAYLGRGTLQYHWAERAKFVPEQWGIHFLVRLDGRVVGVQTVTATDFGTVREIRTGSWLGLRHQRQGIGTEMRVAVLQLAFDHLDAVAARSAAFVDNVASQRLSERLGYRHDGSATVKRRGVGTELTWLLLTPNRFVRPRWTVGVDGLEACRPLLGAG